MSGRTGLIARGKEVRRLIRAALAEDVGDGDATTTALVPEDAMARAAIVAKTRCVVAGAEIACGVFRAVDRRIRCIARIPDGREAPAGARVMIVSGPAAGILTAERTALNFLQRLSGIATLARAFVRKAAPAKVTILDTRKTTPTLRLLEKYAVRCGGGRNHRMGLYDAILVKDNHKRVWLKLGAGGLGGAIAEARHRFPHLSVEVEVETEAELKQALEARPDWILLDNMPAALLRRCARTARGRCRLEASGGVNLGNVFQVAASGVDAISIGALTHSAPAADMALEIQSVCRSRWKKRRHSRH